MRYALFLGCTIPVRAQNYELATRKIGEVLGIEFVDIPNFSFLASIQGTEFYEEAETKGWHQNLKALGVPVTISENWPVDALLEIQTIASREFPPPIGATGNR